MTIKLYYQNIESNFGDLLSKEVVEYVGADNVDWSPLKKAELVALGSLGERIALKKFKRYLLCKAKPLDIWGTGFLSPGRKISDRFVQIYALRGLYSKDRFGISSSVVLGDPGYLTPLIYKNLVLNSDLKNDKSILCLPHLHDGASSKWIDKIYNIFPNKKVISLNLSDSFKKIVTSIARADCVISTAMHPLIVAQSFGIPFVWVESGNNIHSGSRYKFEDTFSVFKSIPESILLEKLINNRIFLSDLNKAMDSSLVPDHLISTVQQDLISSFPRKRE